MKVKIVDRVLTAEERHHSIYVMRDQAVIGGLAGSCGSETLLVILALSLGVPASLLSCSG